LEFLCTKQGDLQGGYRFNISLSNGTYDLQGLIGEINHEIQLYESNFQNISQFPQIINGSLVTQNLGSDLSIRLSFRNDRFVWHNFNETNNNISCRFYSSSSPLLNTLADGWNPSIYSSLQQSHTSGIVAFIIDIHNSVTIPVGLGSELNLYP
jgi:hypothetical protein